MTRPHHQGAGLDLIGATGISQEGTTPRRMMRFVAYCNGGVASTTVLLALHRLGVRDYANYDGSWNEWGNLDTVPIEHHQERQ